MRFRRLSPHIRATAATLVLSGFLGISLSGQTSLTNEITDMLRDELDLDRIAVTLVDTEATLAGEVPTLWDKTRAINQTLAVEGVETLVSEITIPGGEDDNDLAGQVGQAIRTYRFMTIWDDVGVGVEDGLHRHGHLFGIEADVHTDA